MPAQIERRTRHLAWALIGLIGLWLVASLSWVNIEFDDGYATIANSQYLLGVSPDLFWQRGPLMAVWLLPAEWLANLLQLHPLDVRLHHAAMALLHLAYLAMVWRSLARLHGARPAVLLAFVAAVPTVLYFSYAAFISHDLFPGLLTLWLLWLADRELVHPRRASLWPLILLGAALPLIKQTYALVWPAALMAVIGSRWIARERPDQSALARLCAAATASGLLTWLGYCAFLTQSFPDLPWLLKPLGQYLGVYRQVEQSAPARELIDQWLYLRNLSAYGMLAMMLALPGVWFSLRSASSIQRTLAVAWILLVGCLVAIPFKEVRYLGFLAPLTAHMIVPAIDLLARRSLYRFLCGLVLCADLSLAGIEALRLRHPYYREAVLQFLQDLPSAPGSTPQVALQSPLSFVSPEPYAFRNDRFHRITHIIGDQIRLLYGYPRSSLLPADERAQAQLQPGAIVFLINGMASRRPPFRRDNLPDLDTGYIQAVTVAEAVRLRLEGTEYRLDSTDPRPLMLMPAPGIAQQPIAGADRFPAEVVASLRGLAHAPATLDLIGLRVRGQCNSLGCRRL